MKTSIIVGVLTILLPCLPATARLDETPAQCQERYGTPVREIAGTNGVPMVRFYHKNGLEIIAVFVGPTTNDATVGMIFYSDLDNFTPTIRSGSMKPGEEQPLLTTVPGRWEPFAPPPVLKSTGVGKPMTPTPTLIEKRRDECRTIALTFMKTLYPVSSGPTSVDIGHVGNTKFAFRIPAGVAIATYDAFPAIRKWHDEFQRQQAEAKRPPKRDLSGF